MRIKRHLYSCQQCKKEWWAFTSWVLPGGIWSDGYTNRHITRKATRRWEGDRLFETKEIFSCGPVEYKGKLIS